MKKTKSLGEIREEMEALEIWIKNPENYWISMFAHERGYHPSRLKEWAEKDEDFNEIYKKAQSLQSDKIVMCALENKFNAKFAQFVLGKIDPFYEEKVEKSDPLHVMAEFMKQVNENTSQIPIKENYDQKNK